MSDDDDLGFRHPNPCPKCRRQRLLTDWCPNCGPVSERPADVRGAEMRPVSLAVELNTSPADLVTRLPDRRAAVLDRPERRARLDRPAHRVVAGLRWMTDERNPFHLLHDNKIAWANDTRFAVAAGRTLPHPADYGMSGRACERTLKMARRVGIWYAYR